MAENETIKSRGFLSAEIDVYRSRYRRAFRKSFDACQKASDLATQRLFEAGLTRFDGVEHAHVVTSIAFWMRCVSTCQATVLLLERGMVPEAQTLIRTAYEFLFFSVAVLNDPGGIRELGARRQPRA